MKHAWKETLVGFGERNGGAELYYRARCACGYETGRHRTDASAREALLRHERYKGAAR